jgi:hypothetical protein
MNHTQGLAIIVENKQASNAVLLHHCYRFGGERISPDVFGIPGHQLVGVISENIALSYQAASQIAIGDDPGQFPPSVDNPGDTQSLRGDLEKSVLDGRVFANQRKFIATMHEIFDAQEKPSA